MNDEKNSIKKISNPLTIIGLFAGIAEVAGTIVLPFVTPDLQHVFLWYVMGFPVLLVVAFFVTLNFNRYALYAPSDYRDESNFMRLVKAAATDIDNKLGTLRETVREKDPIVAKELETIQSSSNILREVLHEKRDRLTEIDIRLLETAGNFV